MKIYFDYETVKQFAVSKAQEMKNENFDCVVAVVRGGLTIAHIIAKELRLPVGVFYPKEQHLYLPTGPNSKILIVEDLIAEGRTTKIIHKFFKDFEYKYYPFLVDANYKKEDFDYYSIKTKDWIVFPWEDFNKMQEGDRGLFRDKTDLYGKS